MRVGIALIAAAVMLSGCSSLPGNEEADIVESLPDLPFAATLGNMTLTAGAPFNVTLNSTLDANLTMNATWSYAVFEAVAEVQENATMNGTADGNATENVTADPMPVAEGNGTGLPAVVNMTLDGGNFTVTFTASLAGYADATAAVDLVVATVEGAIEVVVEEVEEALCAGTPDPMTITFSGSLLLPGANDHDIEVPPCFTSLHAAIDILVGGDMDYYLFDPSGKQRASAASFGVELAGAAGEPDLTVTNDDGLMVGIWVLNIENFASVATDYDVTVTLS